MPARPPPPEDAEPTDSDLAHEQQHLIASRAALTRMRARVSGLSATGGNAVSTEYLKAALWHRMRALEDDPDVPLFFGRLDTDGATAGSAGSAGSDERFYIGRRHVTDEAGDPARDRLAGAGVPRVLPGQRPRAHGRARCADGSASPPGR